MSVIFHTISLWIPIVPAIDDFQKQKSIDLHLVQLSINIIVLNRQLNLATSFRMTSFRGNFFEEFMDDFQSILSENEDDHDGNKIRTTCCFGYLFL